MNNVGIGLCSQCTTAKVITAVKGKSILCSIPAQSAKNNDVVSSLRDLHLDQHQVGELPRLSLARPIDRAGPYTFPLSLMTDRKTF